MSSFLDKNSRKWIIEVNVGTARRVKTECNIDLLNSIEFKEDGTVDMGVLEEIGKDIYNFVGLLWSLCHPQAEKDGIGEEAFAEAFNADVVENAFDALLKEIINFFPPAKRQMLALIYERTRVARKREEQKALELMDSKEFKDGLDEQLNNLFTNTQESSASIPAPSPSGN